MLGQPSGCVPTANSVPRLAMAPAPPWSTDHTPALAHCGATIEHRIQRCTLAILPAIQAGGVPLDVRCTPSQRGTLPTGADGSLCIPSMHVIGGGVGCKALCNGISPFTAPQVGPVRHTGDSPSGRHGLNQRQQGQCGKDGETSERRLQGWGWTTLLEGMLPRGTCSACATVSLWPGLCVFPEKGRVLNTSLEEISM